MELCIGDVVRQECYRMLRDALTAHIVELSKVSIRVYQNPGKNLRMRIWAGYLSPEVLITTFPYHNKISIPFADPELFNKVVKIAVELLA